MSATQRTRREARLVGLLLLSAAGSCSGTTERPDATPEDARDDPQLVFWESLQALCGLAFEGRVVESVPASDAFDTGPIVVHVRECDPGEIRMPFHVGADRSRTWVVTTTAAGLRLEHVHRHEDGTEDAVSRYGGDTRGRGEAGRQDFPADDFTTRLVPEAAQNVWTLEVQPGSTLAYALRREGSERRFRVDFDLTRPVRPPPPPWGG